jgi:hypothetical protein
MDANLQAQGVPLARVPVSRVTFVAAIRGPVVLITIGILFALDYSAGIRFGKTWPILLIVAGLLHLLGRVGAKHVVDGNVASSHPGVDQL